MKNKTRITTGLSLLGSTIAGAITTAFCGFSNLSSVNVQSNVDAESVFNKVLSLIFLFARYVGAGFAIYGLFTLSMAMKNDEPESKQKAILQIAAGILVFSLKSLAQGVGLISK